MKDEKKISAYDKTAYIKYNAEKDNKELSLQEKVEIERKRLENNRFEKEKKAKNEENKKKRSETIEKVSLYIFIVSIIICIILFGIRFNEVSREYDKKQNDYTTYYNDENGNGVEWDEDNNNFE